MTTQHAPLYKSDFIGLDDCVWLYNGAESPPLRGAADALGAYMTYRGSGPGGREQNAAVEENCRRQLAALMNGQPEQIALLGNTSDAISHIALALELKAGDNVVINTLEFPSGVLPWLEWKARGVEVRVVPHRNWAVPVADVIERVDGATRLVMASHVSYMTGARCDYRALYEQLQSTNALLLLDATQSLGVVPVDLEYSDFIVSSTYKWLLATHGAGVLGVNPRRTAALMQNDAVRPIGWRGVSDMFSAHRFEKFTRHTDARQFETGYPSYPTLYALDFSTRLLLGTGLERIAEHVLQLGERTIAGLEGLGFEVMTPRTPEGRAGNIAWICPRGEELAQALQEQRIFLWGGDGRARASMHGFNDEDDIARLLEALRAWKNGQ